MATVTVNEQSLYDTADAIRTKLGVETTYYPSEFASAIASITGGTELSASDEGKVVVEDDGSYVLQSQTSQTITSNGTYDTTTISEIIANVAGGGNAIGHGSEIPSSSTGSNGDLWLVTAKDAIRNAAEQYIITDYVPNSNTVAEFEFVMRQVQGGSWGVVIGSRDADNGVANAFGYVLAASHGNHNTFSVQLGSTAANAIGVGTDSTLRKYVKVILSNSKCETYINGELADTTTYSAISLSGTYPLSVFSMNAGGDPNRSWAFTNDIDFMELKIYENDVLLKDYVAALGASDAPCLHETIGDNYFYNGASGSLSFVEGGGVAYVMKKVNGSWVSIEGESADINIGGGSKNILSGTSEPSASEGSDGDLYIRYGLPYGYTLLDKVIFTGTQYINTGYVTQPSTRYVLDYKPVATGSGNNAAPFGARSTASAAATAGAVCVMRGDSNYVAYAFGNALTQQSGTDMTAFYGTETSIKLSSSSMKISNGTTTHEYALQGESTTVYPIFLGTMNQAGSALSQCYTAMELYDFKIYENDYLVHHFVPAKNNSNTAGIFDLTTSSFLMPLGGTVQAGSGLPAPDLIGVFYLKVNGSWVNAMGQDIDDVNLGGGGSGGTNVIVLGAEPTSAVGSNGDICVKTKAYGIPSSATVVEYLQSNGTQYIDTSLVPSGTTGIYIETYSVEANVFGARNSNFMSKGLIVGGNNDTINGVHFDYNGSRHMVGSTRGNPIKVCVRPDLGYGYIESNGIVLLYDSLSVQSANTCSYAAILFGYRNNDGVQKSSCKISYVELYDNGTTVAKYVPVLDGNGVACMYECVSQQYVYGGGDPFTYGNATTGDAIVSAYLKVNNSWVDLIGADKDDIRQNGGGSTFTILELRPVGDSPVVTMSGNTLQGTWDENGANIIRYAIPTSGSISIVDGYISMNAVASQYLEPISLASYLPYVRPVDLSDGAVTMTWSDRSLSTKAGLSGMFVIGIGRTSNGFYAPALYTLTDYGVVGNVINGSNVSKLTHVITDPRDGVNTITIYSYGGFGGGYSGDISVSASIGGTTIFNATTALIDFFCPYGTEAFNISAFESQSSDKIMSFVSMLLGTAS